MRSGSLFSGYEGLGMAVNAVFGSTTAWVSDVDKGANKVLAHRYPDAPNLGDITKIDWSSVEPVDVLSGGFPCQDLSPAGKRAGLKPGTRSGLWTHMAYGISKLRPRYVVAENVRGLLSAEAHSDVEPCPWCMGSRGDGLPHVRALGAVLGDLAELGYDTQWCGLRASDVGACHNRFRIFLLAEDSDQSTSGERWEPASGQAQGGRAWPDIGRRSGALASDADCKRRERFGSVSSEPSQSKHVRRNVAVEWGRYEAGIRRHERVLGRLAPSPVEPAPKGGMRLSPRFEEWMMMLPDGWINDVPSITRQEAMKLAGNGVVPLQAETALRHMLGQI